MTKSKRLLLLAYFYPPLGGPAVQRPCKTVKYLTALGWDVDVITIGDIVYHSTDESLLRECSHRKVMRTASLDPMYLLSRFRKMLHIDTGKLYFGTAESRKSRLRQLFPIDHKIGWIPFAIHAGKQALLTDRYAAVMVTCGPFSSILAALRLAKLGKIPLILDYRDLWSQNYPPDSQHGWQYALLQLLERKLLHKAALICTATAWMKDMLTAKFGTSLKDRILPVFNGWDEADFTHLHRKRQPDGKIRISYIGTLYGARPLTALYQALQQISSERTDLAWELQMVGNFYPETHQEAQAGTISSHITFIPQQDHATAIQLMLDADVLLLVIGTSERKWVLTGKLFEYLRCQRPILTLAAPDCEAAGILTSCGHESPCPIDNADAIRACLLKIFGKLEDNSFAYKIPEEYERSQQVNNLNSALLKLLG